MKHKLTIFDATLRDGSHYVKHQYTADFVYRYCQAIDDTGLDAIIVGHGNGLGASSIQIGLSKCPENLLLQAAKKALKQTKLGVYMIPGFGTIKDNLIPAIKYGAQIFKIGCHCSECDTTKQHIKFLANEGFDVYCCLMMSHMLCAEDLLIQGLKVQDYGAKGIILFDSAGAYTLNDVRQKIRTLVKGLNIEVGFHGHNNLGLAVANTLVAIEQGATIVDGTLKGLGAGAGNCQLDVLIPVLAKNGECANVNYFKLIDVADKYVEEEINYKNGISSISIISGLSGVFSAFKNKVLEAAKLFKVDPKEIFIELGKRKVVGGQEDIILDVAMNLSQRKHDDDLNYLVESLL